MAEYIDKNETIITFGFTYDDIAPTPEEVVKFLRSIKAEDVVPATRGEWVGTDWAELVCSNCLEEAPYVSHFKETFDYDRDENLVSTGYEETKEYQRTKYCPNCGARMKEANYE